MEFTEDKLKAELQHLEAALAERDGAASLAALSEKKQLEEEKHSALSCSPNDTTLEEQELHSIKTELVRVVYITGTSVLKAYINKLLSINCHHLDTNR
jgi:hypothetical protein